MSPRMRPKTKDKTKGRHFIETKDETRRPTRDQETKDRHFIGDQETKDRRFIGDSFFPPI